MIPVNMAKSFEVSRSCQTIDEKAKSFFKEHRTTLNVIRKLHLIFFLLDATNIPISKYTNYRILPETLTILSRIRSLTIPERIFGGVAYIFIFAVSQWAENCKNRLDKEEARLVLQGREIHIEKNKVEGMLQKSDAPYIREI